jgi:hypothetical protein
LFKQLLPGCRLQSGEPKYPLFILFNNKIDSCIAEVTNAVKKDHRLLGHTAKVFSLTLMVVYYVAGKSTMIKSIKKPLHCNGYYFQKRPDLAYCKL